MRILWVITTRLKLFASGGLDASNISTLAIIGFGTQTVFCADVSMWDFRV